MSDKISTAIGVFAIGVAGAIFWLVYQPAAEKPAPQKIEAVQGGIDARRFAVTKVATFRDDDAYRHTRAIYLIVDRTTGQEFVGVSGIGISEVGSHREGTTKQRHSVEDER